MGNFPYDFKTLFSATATQADFDNSLRHYQTWANIPTVAVHILHVFLGLGFIGLTIKIYKPDDEIKYFEYGSLLLYVIAVCIYLTNLKIGAESALHEQWGEVDQNTGINVIAASEVIILFILGFIIALQVGLYWGQVDYQQRLEVFQKEEAEEEQQAKLSPKVDKAVKIAKKDDSAKKEAVKKSSGAQVKPTSAVKTRSKKS